MVPLTACNSLRIRNPVPANLTDKARVPGLPPTIRTWGDNMSPEFVATFARSREQTVAWYKAHPDQKFPETVDILALSGGGADGAFGAGLLCGWTRAGNRPQFRLVTGISTGALMAPFAFLGSSCDERLKAAYTTTSTEDILLAKSLFDSLRSDSATEDRLASLITHWVDGDMIKAIAAEHAKGRRLFMATVNLDAQRQVIWDMGEIASSTAPSAPQLFRDIMRASAAIPVAFPPLYLSVEAGGKTYDEMHVDGGTMTQVFLWDASLSLAAAERQLAIKGPLAPVRIFIVRNSYIHPQWKKVEPRLKDIAPRAIGTLLKSEGVGDLFRLYATCQRDGFDFNAAHIPSDFSREPKEAFDTAYMNELFNVGFSLGRNGYHWQKNPFYLADSPPATAPSTAPGTTTP
jgi:hypothetical protein